MTAPSITDSPSAKTCPLAPMKVDDGRGEFDDAAVVSGVPNPLTVDPVGPDDNVPEREAAVDDLTALELGGSGGVAI